MFPVLFNLGPIPIYTFGLTIVLGSIVSLNVMYYLCQKNTLNFRFFQDNIIFILFYPLFVSRIFHVILNWSQYRTNLWEIIFLFDGGFSFWVFFGVLVLTILFYTHRFNQLVFLWTDKIMTSFYAFMTFAFIGFSISSHGTTGIALGNPTDLPWGVVVGSITSPFANVPVHPLTLYLAVCALFLAIWGVLYKNKPGFFTFGSMLVFGTVGVIIELLRWESRYLVNFFNTTINGNIILSVIIIICGISGLIFLFRTKTADPMTEREVRAEELEHSESPQA